MGKCDNLTTKLNQNILPNSIKVALVIGHGQLGIVHLGKCRAYMYGTRCYNVLE